MKQSLIDKLENLIWDKMIQDLDEQRARLSHEEKFELFDSILDTVAQQMFNLISLELGEIQK